MVAHLVLAHQTQMHNLITPTNYQTRLAQYAEASGKATAEDVRRRIEKPAEQLLHYLLFANEAPIEGTIDPQSAFAAEFAARGLRDAQGRSLRDFDLQKRFFKYPCSYLIYSEAFNSIPEPAKSYINRRLLEILSGQDETPDFASLSAGDRRAILEILAATKPGSLEERKQFVNPISKGNQPYEKSAPDLRRIDLLPDLVASIFGWSCHSVDGSFLTQLRSLWRRIFRDLHRRGRA